MFGAIIASDSHVGFRLVEFNDETFLRDAKFFVDLGCNFSSVLDAGLNNDYLSFPYIQFKYQNAASYWYPAFKQYRRTFLISN